MSTRFRIVLVALAAAVVGGVAYTQTGPPAPRLQPPADRIPPQDVPPPVAHIPPATRPTETPDKSLDQLLDRLESLRAQKAELEKAEAEVVKEVRRKLEKQSDRLQRLGIGAPPPAAPVAPPVFTPEGVPAPPGLNRS